MLDITQSSFHNRVLVHATTILPSTTPAATAYASALDHQSSNAITTISHIDNKAATTTATAITTKDHNQTNTGLATAATTTTARPCHHHQPPTKTHKPLSSMASHCHPRRNHDGAVATALASTIATTHAITTTTAIASALATNNTTATETATAIQHQNHPRHCHPNSQHHREPQSL
jgi:hypothetical protein